MPNTAKITKLDNDDDGRAVMTNSYYALFHRYILLNTSAHWNLITTRVCVHAHVCTCTCVRKEAQSLMHATQMLCP